MRKYYYKDDQGQQYGPVKLDKLKSANLKPSTPIWYDPLPKWTTAGEVDELKILFAPAGTAVQSTAPVADATEVKKEVVAVKAPVIPASAKGRKYYYKDEQGLQQGPVKFDKLSVISLKPGTPIWYDPLPKWTTAGEIDELRSLLPQPEIIKAAEPVVVESKQETIIAASGAGTIATETKETLVETKEEVKPAEIKEEVKTVAPVIEMKETSVTFTVSTGASAGSASGTINPVQVAPTPSAVAAAQPVMPRTAYAPAKGDTAWISWLISILVLAGVGFYIYQDIEKSKSNTGGGYYDRDQDNNNDDGNRDYNNNNLSDTTLEFSIPEATLKLTPSENIQPIIVDRSNNNASSQKTTTSIANKKAEELKKQKELEAKNKAAEEEQKRARIAEAAAEKDQQIRNNWRNYISFGTINYNTKGNIDAFDIPVYNGTDAMIDKVTIRVDYLKKDKKIIKTETVTIFSIPPKSSGNATGPESKRGDKVNVYITGINSRQLHFCYPQNNGNSADPYFCN